jgi:protein phosphatase
MIEFGHLTHVGLRRELNEDTYYGDSELGLWLVPTGWAATNTAKSPAPGDARRSCARSAKARRWRRRSRIADEEIIRASRQAQRRAADGHDRGRAARINGNRFEVAWVGDSRVYLWRDGKLAQLSQDHSYVQELISQGAISVEQARSHPHRNVVTQALGVTDPQNLNVETLSGELQPGMQLLLCSDGLTEEVDDRGISKVLAHDECSAQECVDGLVAAALDGGGSDNVTVVLVRRH